MPDGFRPDPDYIEQVRPGGTAEGSDDHKVLYNIESLSRLMIQAGFEVHPLEYFDSKGKFVKNPWDVAEGKITRSVDFDERNLDGVIRYSSLIIDGLKPGV